MAYGSSVTPPSLPYEEPSYGKPVYSGTLTYERTVPTIELLSHNESVILVRIAYRRGLKNFIGPGASRWK
jgi:hypothetical protein